MDRVKVLGYNETYVSRFRLYGSKLTFKFNNPPPGVNELEWVKGGFGDIVNECKAKAYPNDYLGFTLHSLNFKNKEPGYVSFRPAGEVTKDVLWNIFGGLIQSNADSITSRDTFKVECTRVNLPVGNGTRRRPGLYNNFNEECRARRGIVVINNNDNLCLARALVVGKAHAKSDPQYKAIRQDDAKRQTLRAKKLILKAGVDIPEEGAGIQELRKFQNHLQKYNITVFNYNSKGRDVYFCGENSNALYNINLLYSEGHYNVITNLTAAFACGYFCEACHIPYDHKGEHRCKNVCQACQVSSPPCIMVGSGIVCSKCNRRFKNQACFDAHKGDVCNRIKLCTDCHKLIFVTRRRKTLHICGEVFCDLCCDFKQENHKCYMKPDTGKPPSEDFLFIFFDLETRQDEEHPSDSSVKVHKVNLCVSQQYCYKCIDGSNCDICSDRIKVFKENPINEFMSYVMEVRKKYKHVCAIAHNGQGFDFQFILRYLFKETKFSPKTIMRGTKLILLQVDNVRFVDSLSYFPMALAELPKAFDLPPEKKKGYFPHLFNTLANQNYVGPMPAKEYYCPESMFDKSYRDFEIWHKEQIDNDYEFDLQKELLEYCMSDVDILAQACIKFRALLLEQCNVDPFLEAVTIASACNLAFRRNFLKPNTIGLIPKNGYRLNDNQSAAALQWLTWEEDQREVRIQHAGRGREVKIEGLKVDGFDGERIYEFHGCYWHGCPKCFPYKREEPLKDDPSDNLHLRYERTKLKTDKLLKAQYEVIEMWECEFNNLKKEHNLTYLNSIPVLNTLPLNPRDAFFGGRTGNTKTYHKCEEGETIQYVDVCSLYPWVCKYGKYPVSHPKIYVGDSECRSRGMSVEGLLKCKVLPPHDLYHPVLPTRLQDKLMFLLCKKCGEELNQGDCKHNEDERALVGVWTMDEIRKAVEKGYIIIEMFELWEYKVANFESGGLFTDFINKFLKIKQEASGYPSWCKTEEDRDRYIEQYHEHEGIRLEKEKICKNGGLRSLAKLMLNSFWGKFGQRENQTKSIVIRDPKEFFNLLTSPWVQVNYVQEINEEALLVSWQNLDEVSESLRTVNVVIAAYTTAQARLKLYEYLEALGNQVLYYDTDSCVFVYKNGLYRVDTGDYLGQMTDELAKDYGPGSYIIEFVSGGPKTYAYLVWSTNKNELVSVCKIKGLTLNMKTCKTINFEKLKNMVLSEVVQTVELEENRIRRTRERDIITVNETKLFKVTGPKRKLEGEYDTLPYGYKKQKV